MSSGTVHVEGNAGRHVGSEMAGGEIHVSGDAGDWVGGEMHGGLIHVHGRAGHLIGAAYRGSRRGMTGGTILIDGDVGNEIGHTMRRGLLAVGGMPAIWSASTCWQAQSWCSGRQESVTGQACIAGRSDCCRQSGPTCYPAFVMRAAISRRCWRMLWRQLGKLGFAVPDELLTRDLDLYNGDLIEGGRGEMLLRA